MRTYLWSTPYSNVVSIVTPIKIGWFIQTGLEEVTGTLLKELSSFPLLLLNSPDLGSRWLSFFSPISQRIINCVLYSPWTYTSRRRHNYEGSPLSCLFPSLNLIIQWHLQLLRDGWRKPLELPVLIPVSSKLIQSEVLVPLLHPT